METRSGEWAEEDRPQGWTHVLGGTADSFPITTRKGPGKDSVEDFPGRRWKGTTNTLIYLRERGRTPPTGRQKREGPTP